VKTILVIILVLVVLYIVLKSGDGDVIEDLVDVFTDDD
jgi:hypothetical protein